MSKICVLGGGIVGLTTAYELQPYFNVILIADKFNEETTSDGAAGIFRPGHGFSGPTPQITKDWITKSYNHYAKLIDQNCGVKEISGYIYANSDPSIVENSILEGLLPEYRKVTKDELNGWKYGSYFKTMVIECRIHLPWLRKKFEEIGGRVIKKHIKNFDELKNFDIVVNCTGLGAKYLCNDSKIVPISGQVFKVEAPWLDKFYYGEYDTYVIPGISHITLGGSRKYDSWSTSVSKYTSEEIWDKCTQLVPSLKKARVIQEWVGLRPHREGGVRVEKETLQNGLTVIHNYGHGGYGVTTAPGTSKYAAQLVIQHLTNSHL